MQNLWIDTDIALGSLTGDVDDGYALAAIVRAVQHQPKRFRLLGVSAVAGNTDAATAHGCAQRLLAAADMTSVPVVTATDAADAIAALPAGTSLVALGPLTNVARALQRDPAIATRSHLRTVGGLLRPWRHPVLRFFCLNFRTDPAAARQVLSTAFGLRRNCPLDVVSHLRVGSAELAQVRQTSALGAYLADHTVRWLKQAPWRYASQSFPVWDLVATLDAVDQLNAPRYDLAGQRLAAFDAEASFENFLTLLRAPSCRVGFASAPHVPG